MKYLPQMVIKNVTMDEDSITLDFGNSRLTLTDCNQSCCEQRYMSTDDDIRKLVGSRFICYEIKEGADDVDEYGEHHDTQFLEIQTDQGFVTLVNHNEHNGYYGGFDIEEQWS